MPWGPELATGEQECLLGSQPEAPSNEGARAELSGHCGAGWLPRAPGHQHQQSPAAMTATQTPCPSDTGLSDTHS